MRVYIESYGCAMNDADTEVMIAVLEDRGHVVVSRPEEADVIIINTCTVRLDTEERMKSRIKRLRELAKRRGAKLVVAGCMAKAQPGLVLRLAPEASLVSPQNVERVWEAVESDEQVILLREDGVRHIISSFRGGTIATIPIAQGCLGSCSYCIVKVARGRLRSYDPDVIARSVRRAVSLGAVEVRLTAQDTAAYGLDIGWTLPKLVNYVLDEVEGDYTVRIGMMNPRHAMRILDELVEVLKRPRVFKFIHLPVQSGDDRVLKLMNRGYTVDEYKSIVRELRAKVPEIAVATDIIVGHPGEDEEAFENTLRLIRELEFDRIHIAQYTIRPHTESAAMPQVRSDVKKRRLLRAVKLAEEVTLRRHQRLVGRRLRILLTEDNRDGTLTGRTISYHPVVVRASRDVLGLWAEARIIHATFYDLKGEVLEVSRRESPSRCYRLVAVRSHSRCYP